MKLQVEKYMNGSRKIHKIDENTSFQLPLLLKFDTLGVEDIRFMQGVESAHLQIAEIKPKSKIRQEHCKKKHAVSFPKFGTHSRQPVQIVWGRQLLDPVKQIGRAIREDT